jgi:hypothetical protein
VRDRERGDRETNRDRETNIDNDIDIDVDDGWDGDWVGGGFVAGAFWGAAVGSMFYGVPAGCGWYSTWSSYYCGGAWYAPQYQGDDVTYVVVEAPAGSEGVESGAIQPDEVTPGEYQAPPAQ